MRRNSFAAILMTALLAAPLALGQTPAGDDTLAALKSRSSLTDDDRQKLSAWVDASVESLVGGDAGAAVSLRSIEDGTDAFKEAYGVALSAAVSGRYKQAEEGRAAQLLALLGVADTIDAHRTFVEALRDERVSVRAAAAIGLRTLQRRIAAAGGAYFTEAMEALRAAMKAEASPVALRMMYAALDYKRSGASAPDPKISASVLLDVLESRGTVYDKDGGRAFAADGPGLSLAVALAPQMSDGDKTRLAKAAATIMKGAIGIYTTDYLGLDARRNSALLVRTRDALEVLIAEAERAVVAALGSAKVSVRLAPALETGDKTKIYQAMNEWADALRDAGLGDFSVGP